MACLSTDRQAVRPSDSTSSDNGGNWFRGRGVSWNGLAETFSFLWDLALGETAATEVKRRWNAEGAKHPPMLSHYKSKGWRHRSEEKHPAPESVLYERENSRSNS